MTRVLVTGYGGFLGREIVRQLLCRGYKVRGLARQSYPALQALGVEGVCAGIEDRRQVNEAIAGCDAVIHTAAQAGVWGPWQRYYRVNTAGTSNVIEGAVRNACRTIVFTSSPSVTFAPQHQSGIDESTAYPRKYLCAYPHTKALAEQAVLEAARGPIRACALRPHLIWGEGDPHLFPRIIERARAGKLRRVGSGRNLIDVVHVRNAAKAHVQALEQLLDQDPRINGKTFFITDGMPVECWSWISRVLTTAGLPVPQRSISYAMAYRIGFMFEKIFGWLSIEREPPMTRFVAAQLALDHYYSIARARDLLGYAPEIDVELEFERCRTWLRSS